MAPAREHRCYQTTGFEQRTDSDGNQLPYRLRGITRTIIQHRYNPLFGDGRTCTCGHSYYRHFDSHENNTPVGCKYCACFKFVEKKD
jgi:hypothetical protein